MRKCHRLLVGAYRSPIWTGLQAIGVNWREERLACTMSNGLVQNERAYQRAPPITPNAWCMAWGSSNG